MNLTETDSVNLHKLRREKETTSHLNSQPMLDGGFSAELLTGQEMVRE